MENLPVGLLNGVGVVGLSASFAVWFVRALAKGTICTGRELAEKNARIENLEVALSTRDEQVNAALAVLPEAVSLLQESRRPTMELEGDI